MSSRATNITAPTRNRVAICCARLRVNPSRLASISRASSRGSVRYRFGTPVTGGNGRGPTIEGAVVLSITCTTESAELFGVTEAGETVQVDSEGAPEQANAID